MTDPAVQPSPLNSSAQGPSLWATLPAACEELVLSLLSQQAMAVLACVNRAFRDHVRTTRVRKRALDIAPGTELCGAACSFSSFPRACTSRRRQRHAISGRCWHAVFHQPKTRADQ